MNRFYVQIIYSFFVFAIITNAQTLIDGAESVAFDTLNNRYLVSSLNTNKIISIDMQGNQTAFKEGITAFGNCIKDDVFYVSGGTHVRGLDVNTAEIVFDVSVSGSQQLDGVTTDNNGNLYVVETIRNWIYKINVSDKSVKQFASAGSGQFPQDIIYDKFHDRLLLAFWHSKSAVLSIDVSTGAVDTAVATETGFFDGISIDNDGNIYLASHVNGGRIIMYDNNFDDPPAIISTGYDEPAGLDVNLRDNILAVPSFAGDRVDFIQLPAVYLNLDVKSSEPRGHTPLSVDFESLISGSSPIDLFEWDFDSNGTIDSYEKNPTWTFSEPGTYSINLKVIMDTLVKEIVLDEYVQAFNNNSSIEFTGEGGNALIEAVPELALDDEWTFFAWIKPRDFGRNIVFYKNALQIYTNANPSSSLNANSLVVRIYKEEGGYETFSTPESSIKQDNWQQVAVSYSYSKKLFGIYLDGSEIFKFEGDHELFESIIKTNTEDNIIIGNNVFGIRNFDGAIDNVELWNEYKEAGEIKELKETVRSGTESGLMGLWKMDEGEGNSVSDATSNGNDGVLTDALFTHGVDISLYTDVELKDSKSGHIPNEFALYENYPNPFNPSTTIEYEIPAVVTGRDLSLQHNVRLVIYDIIGREVATLINRQREPGKYSVQFDGTGLSSGVYFYQLTTGKFSQINKMMLMK